MSSKHFTPLVLAFPLFVWLPALAQNTLTVPIEVVRVSNPDLSAESRGSVTLYRVHPQYTLRNVQESSRTELSLGGMIERSSNTDLSASRTLPSVGVLWESARPVEVFQLRAWTRNLTPGSTLELAAAHLRVSYDTPLLVDYNETMASTAYRSDLSPIARYSLSASASRLNPSGDFENASRVELGLGYERNLQEGFTLSAEAGAVHTRAGRSKTEPVGALRLNYAGERGGYAVGWSREVSAGGSLGGYERSERFEASWTYPFTLNTSIDLGVAHARSLEADGDAGASAYARIRSELTRFWAFTMGLEHRRAMPFTGPTARGNVVSVGLVYAHPDF